MSSPDSPGGRFQIGISAWEARMSHWIETPSITDTTTGRRILGFRNGNWSLDKAEWQDANTVLLTMRKYPGNHKPVDLTVRVDCDQLTASLDDRPVGSLDQLEHAMDRALDFY